MKEKESGEARLFDPFDCFAQFKNARDTSPEQRLEEFVLLRKENLAALESLNLSDEDLTGEKSIQPWEWRRIVMQSFHGVPFPVCSTVTGIALRRRRARTIF
jgi:hypothetical protein